jgi:hypothetical protein
MRSVKSYERAVGRLQRLVKWTSDGLFVVPDSPTIKVDVIKVRLREA